METKKQTLEKIAYSYGNYNHYRDRRLENMASELLNNSFEEKQVAETTCVIDRYGYTITECSITMAKPKIKLFDDRTLEVISVCPDLTLVFKYADEKYYAIKDQTVLCENKGDTSRPIADFIRRAFVEEAEKLFKSQPMKQPPSYIPYHKIAELGSICATPYGPVNSVILEMKKYFSPDTSIRIDVFLNETAKIIVRHPTVICDGKPLKSKTTRMIEFGATDRAYSREYRLSWLTKSSEEIHHRDGIARLDSAISEMFRCFADFATGQFSLNTLWS